MRLRGTSQYTTVRHDSKRHCLLDLSCQACCSCVQMYKAQNNILKEKIEKLNRQKVQIQKTANKLAKILNELQKRKHQFDNIEQFKLKVRAALKKQLQESKKAEDFILKQRIESAKKEKTEMQHKIQELSNQSEQKDKKIKNIQSQLRSANQKISTLQRNLKTKEQQNKEVSRRYDNLKQKENTLESIVKEKTAAINKISTAIAQTQQNFINQKVRAKNNQFEVLRHQQDIKNKILQITNLQKSVENNKSSIDSLTVEKQKLKKLVQELDSTIGSYSNLSNQLRERILISQDYALQKQIECKKLEMDYYDSLYLKHV